MCGDMFFSAISSVNNQMVKQWAKCVHLMGLGNSRFAPYCETFAVSVTSGPDAALSALSGFRPGIQPVSATLPHAAQYVINPVRWCYHPHAWNALLPFQWSSILFGKLANGEIFRSLHEISEGYFVDDAYARWIRGIKDDISSCADAIAFQDSIFH